MKNCVLIDWLSFTSKIDDVMSIMDLLGFEPSSFQTIDGMYGYHDREYFDGISIHYGGRDEVWVEMSGQGCRVFESFGHGDWLRLFAVLMMDESYHITRLDVAYDDHEGLLDISRIASDCEAGNFVSRWRWWSVTRSSDGISVYNGSPRSDARLRIYDKAAEKGKEEHWIRVELQLRDGRAAEFVRKSLDTPLGELFSGVLAQYIRYVVRNDNDSNNRRWDTSDYWSAFLGDAQRISLYVAPGVEYNFDNLERYVVDQAGAAVAAYIRIVGAEEYVAVVEKKLGSSRNPKYSQLIERCKV